MIDKVKVTLFDEDEEFGWFYEIAPSIGVTFEICEDHVYFGTKNGKEYRRLGISFAQAKHIRDRLTEALKARL